MGKRLDTLLQASALRRWRQATQAAGQMPLSELRARRNQARALRGELDRFLHVAEGRLALPAIGGDRIPHPQGADWIWRPALWRGPLPRPGLCPVPTKSGLGPDACVFHDGADTDIALRQLRNRSERDLAPFGLQIELFRFGGSFLSLALDLPPEAATGLTKSHLVRVECLAELETPLTLYARLNIRHGPNTEQLTRELTVPGGSGLVEFDLAYSTLNEKRIDRLWLDLILDAPRMTRVVLSDLTFARSLRAAI